MRLFVCLMLLLLWLLLFRFSCMLSEVVGKVKESLRRVLFRAS